MDRITKIKSTINKYGEDNFYISFSGGKDSTVLSALVDLAVPGNKIPRVYANTGIEYKLILEFVQREREREHPWELVVLKPSVPIKPTLEKVGYPFKSKKHSQILAIYQKHKTTEGLIGVQHYLHISNDGVNWHSSISCPNILRYQFTPDFPLKISDLCCTEMKEKPLDTWAKKNGKRYTITGMMGSEGGRRKDTKCQVFEKNKLRYFNPLAPMTKEWEDWFIDEYHVDISDLYKAPYNFHRTGCKGCPFAIRLQEELDTLQKWFPAERRQCEVIWKPVYDEYRRLGYRLKNRGIESQQFTIEDWMAQEAQHRMEDRMIEDAIRELKEAIKLAQNAIELLAAAIEEKPHGGQNKNNQEV